MSKSEYEKALRKSGSKNVTHRHRHRQKRHKIETKSPG